MPRRELVMEEKLQILAWIDEGHGVMEAFAGFDEGRHSAELGDRVCANGFQR